MLWNQEENIGRGILIVSVQRVLITAGSHDETCVINVLFCRNDDFCMGTRLKNKRLKHMATVQVHVTVIKLTMHYDTRLGLCPIKTVTASKRRVN